MGEEKFCVNPIIVKEKGKGRYLPEIEHVIGGANLPPRVTQWSLGIFRQLAIAEGKVRYYLLGENSRLRGIFPILRHPKSLSIKRGERNPKN